MSDQADLVRQIKYDLMNSQKSERWAMYRLIVPVVDFANATLRLTPYFEFNQTSEHGTSQSVDIALLDGQEPVAMIEAKRVDRRIGAEQIAKYLAPGVRGIVTNGVNWILCLNGSNKTITIWDHKSETVDTEAVSEIISFLQGADSGYEDWSASPEYVSSLVTPQKPMKKINAQRRSNSVQIASKTNDCLAEIQKLAKATRPDLAFLEAFICSIDKHYGGVPNNGRLEFRASRVSFFDEAIQKSSKRVGRIEIGKQQPDVLVLTNLVENAPKLSSVAKPEPHDKGPHMRRFRLRNEESAKKFGTILGKVIFEHSASTLTR